MKRISLLIVAVSFVALAGCGGGGAKSTTQISTKTLGQELTDLKQARETGAISPQEYEWARAKLLKKYD